MISRRKMFGGLAGLSAPALLTACGARRPPAQTSAPYASGGTGSSTSGGPAVSGLDAVIDISHNVTVSDFAAVRSSGILAVLHKVTEGGDWIDPSYSSRREQAEGAGLLWGGYHFGTRQYSGRDQAAAFLAIARPGPNTLLALDLEPNDRNPSNTMRTDQAEVFVQTVYQATGRLPMVYVHPEWANGGRFGRRAISLSQPVTSSSILARCDLWLADYREDPVVPYAWQDKGWKLWQYLADETVSNAAYGSVPRAVPGVSHCDRNLFAGDEAALYRFWRGTARRA